MVEEFDYGIHYREFNEDTDEYAREMADDLRRSLGKWFPERKDIDVIDIGCGMGFAMLGLKEHGFRTVVGVDVDRSQISACQRRQLDVELISDLGDYLAGHPRRFGLVTMLDVLEHIPPGQQIATLRRVWDALAPGGRLIVRAPNANSIIAPRWQYIDFTHYTSYTEHSIRFAIRSAGFTDVHVPYDDNLEPRPSLRPGKLFTKGNRTQFKRWIIRRLWRQVMMVEMGEKQAMRIPLGVNLLAIADKAP